MEVLKVSVSVPVLNLPLYSIRVLGGVYGLVLIISQGEGDEGIVKNEAIGLSRTGGTLDPRMPEEPDLGVELMDIIEGHVKGMVAFIEATSEKGWGDENGWMKRKERKKERNVQNICGADDSKCHESAWWRGCEQRT